MDAFSYSNPTQVHFGEGMIAQIKEEIPADAKVLVTYGGGSIKKNGVYDQVAAALTGVEWGEFSGIEPNPQYDTLMKAVQKVKAEGFTYLLAVGGGSVIDGTKFISAASKCEGEPWDLLEKEAPVTDAVPLACVLTLPATGSETNFGAVISKGTDKLVFMTPLVRPKFAILDPATTLSLPPRQTANGVVDAFVHVMEQYLTYPVDGKVQDRYAEGLLSTLMEDGPKLLDEPDDLAARANVMWAANQALNGLIGAGVPGDFASHMIGHEMTGLYGIDHARTLTIVLLAIMKQRSAQKKEKILQYGTRVLGIDSGSEEERIDEAIAATEGFFKVMGMPLRFSDVDLDESNIDAIVDALKAHGHSSLGETADIDYAESRRILEKAL